MRRLACALAFAGVCALPVAACAQPATAERSQGLSRAAQEADLADIVAQLERAHPGLYLHQSRAQWQAAIARARQAISDDRPLHDFYVDLHALVRAVACGHTRLDLDPADESRLLAGRVPPISVAIDDGRVFLTGRRGDLTDDLLGAELLALNGEPAAALLRRLLAAMPVDGEGAERGLGLLERRFARLYARHTPGSPARPRLVVRVDGAERVVEMTGESPARGAHAAASTPFRYRTLAGAIGYLDIDAFMDGAGEGYAQFFAGAFERMRRDGARGLIIDLRDNGGGMDDGGSILASYLLDQPFTYYHRIEASDAYAGSFGDPTPAAPGTVRILRRHPSLGVIQPRPEGFRGPVIVLINSGTFSTASDFARQLHRRGRATFVGSETSGGYDVESSGYSHLAILPHSRFALEIPLMVYRNDAVTTRPHRGVPADHQVEPLVADALAGHDRVLAQGLRLAAAAAARGRS